MAVPNLTCPSCGAILKTAQPLPAGKRVRCPKCKSIVTVPEAEDVDQDDPQPVQKPAAKSRPAEVTKEKPASAKRTVARSSDLEDDREENEEQEDPEEERKPKRKKSARGAKKKRTNPALIWGAAGGGAVALLVLVLVLTGVFRGKDSTKGGGGDTKAGSATLKKSLVGHKKSLRLLALNPNGKSLAAGDWAGDVKLWDLESGTESRTLKVNTPWVNCLALSPDGQTLVMGGFAPDLRNPSTGDSLRTLQADIGNIEDAAFSPDGTMLAVAGTADNMPVVIWNTKTWQEIKRFPHAKKHVYRVRFSPDSKTLAVGIGYPRFDEGDSSGHIALYEIATSKQRLFKTPHMVTTMAFHPKRNLLAIADMFENGEIELWDTDKGQSIRSLNGHRSGVAALAFAPDGTLLLSGSTDKTAKLWNVETGQETGTIPRHEAEVHCVAFSSDGKTVAVGGGESGAKSGELKLGDVSALVK